MNKQIFWRLCRLRQSAVVLQRISAHSEIFSVNGRLVFSKPVIRPSPRRRGNLTPLSCGRSEKISMLHSWNFGKTVDPLSAIRCHNEGSAHLRAFAGLTAFERWNSLSLWLPNLGSWLTTISPQYSPKKIFRKLNFASASIPKNFVIGTPMWREKKFLRRMLFIKNKRKIK